MTPALAVRAAARRLLGADTPLRIPTFRRVVFAHAANVLGYWDAATEIGLIATPEPTP